MRKKRSVEFIDVSQRLRSARGERTQAELAREMGVDIKTVGEYERGKTSPNMDFLIRFQRATGVSLDWLATAYVDGQWPLDTGLLRDVIEKAERTVPSAPPAEKASLITEWYVERVSARNHAHAGLGQVGPKDG